MIERVRDEMMKVKEKEREKCSPIFTKRVSEKKQKKTKSMSSVM
jgi:hypothetical protein